MSDERFVTQVHALRYSNERPWNNPARRARWQLLGTASSYGGRELIEDGVEPKRALELAQLLGCEQNVLAVMREEAAKLRKSAAGRVSSARASLDEAQSHARLERAEAQQIELTVAALEVAAASEGKGQG